MHDPAKVVSIYKAANTNEALVICDALRSRGIECQVTEINEPLAGLTIAEPDILVHLADQQRAEEIIAEYEMHRRNDVDQDTEVDDEEGDDELEDDESDIDDIEVEDEDAEP